MISREVIQTLIPHGDSMSLIDTVDYWDESQIKCSVDPYQGFKYPFRTETHSSTMLLIEHGAQASGIHSALLLKEKFSPSQLIVLGAVKNAKLYHDNISKEVKRIQIIAELLINNQNGAIYTFAAFIDNKKVIEAKLICVRTDITISHTTSPSHI